MRIVLFIIASTLIRSLTVQAAKPVFQEYDWQVTPSFHQLDSQYQDQSAVVVQDYRIMEYQVIDAQRTFCYYTVHKIIRLNDDQAIEKFNKVYIPMTGGRRFISLNARVIQPNGVVTALNQRNVRELENAEGHGDFKIFAAEGLEKGSELEYIYTLQGNAIPFGRETFQGEEPILQASLILVYPNHLRFSTKSYHRLPNSYGGSLNGDRRQLVMEAENIPALPKEDYAVYNASLKRIDYRLESNGVTYNFYGWNKVADQLLDYVHHIKGGAKLNRFLSKLKQPHLSEEQKIVYVEQHIKTNYTLRKGSNEELGSLRHVLNNKFANDLGMARLYLYCWKALGIQRPHLVFTTDRYRNLIDPDYPMINDLNQVLFYFPQLNKYVVPNQLAHRLGPAPREVIGNHGLFVTYTDVTKCKRIAHRLDQITGADYTQNRTGVRAQISFPDGITAPIVEQENFYYGYRAVMYRGLFNNISLEKREAFIKSSVTSALDDAQIKNLTLEDESPEMSGDWSIPFTINTHYQTEMLVERAGNDYILQLGKVIGKQSELYQEEERKNDIWIPAPTYHQHTITVQIPDGYYPEGLNAILIDKKVELDGETVMKFKSHYEYKENTLTVYVDETYQVLNLPRKHYQEFRQVINAAADFNKVALVLKRRL